MHASMPVRTESGMYDVPVAPTQKPTGLLRALDQRPALLLAQKVLDDQHRRFPTENANFPPLGAHGDVGRGEPRRQLGAPRCKLGGRQVGAAGGQLLWGDGVDGVLILGRLLLRLGRLLLRLGLLLLLRLRWRRQGRRRCLCGCWWWWGWGLLLCCW
jgi:hypothetical protein